ncbi:MAG: trypsin-like peptidase domain-containing protein [Planctomycetes bacterium]|nr:trypsin-like peptidase domain-containing protein [Planctomycetota bacterium]
MIRHPLFGRRITTVAAVVFVGAAAPVFAQDRFGATINKTLVRAPLRDDESLTKTSTSEVVAAARPAIVRVYVEITEKRTKFAIERPSSGVIVDSSGIVLTFWSLVAEGYEEGKPRAARAVFAQTRDGQKHPLILLAHDETSDLALLAVDGAANDTTFPSLELATSSAVRPGDRCVVLSYHDGSEFAAFSGVLARPQGSTTHRGRGIGVDEFWITDAAIQLRSQGAAVLDGFGRLVGLASAEHVRRQVREPDLEDVLAPSFGIVLPVDAVRTRFRDALRARAPSNKSLLGNADGSEKDTRVPPGHRTVLEQCAESVVGVTSGREAETPLDELDPGATARRDGAGSGVVVTAGGLVLTNLHLLAGRTTARVLLSNGKSLPARLVDSKAGLNIALLEVELPPGAKLRPIEIASADEALPGEVLIAIGKPIGGKNPTVSTGILSAVRRGGTYLQADPNLGNENGGGALVDGTGRLLAVIDGGVMDKRALAFLRRGDQAKAQSNLSTAVSIDTIKKRFSKLSDLAVKAADAAQRSQAHTRVTHVIDKTARGLLNIYVSVTERPANLDDNPFAVTDAKPRIQSLGSGVVIDDSGLAISNWHVVDDATNADGSAILDHVVHARLRDGTLCEVEVLSISREDDLALLRLTVPEGKAIQAVEFGDSDTLTIGETVVAIGNPEGMANTATCGVVSCKDRGINIKHRWAKYEGLIETDAAINGGNSGGALLDLDGRLVGINSAGGSGLEVTGFAIPVNHVRSKLLNLLLSPEKLRSAHTGLRATDSLDASAAVEVRSIDPDTPAARAGIRAGDVITAIDGHPLRWSIDLTMRMLEKKGGDIARLELRRGEETLTKEVACYAADVWACQRQLGASLERIATSGELDTVHRAITALTRRYTNDKAATPTSLPEFVVRVVDAFGEDAVLQKGDLILAAEFVGERGEGKLDRFESVREIQICIDAHSTYEGTKMTFWIYRDDKVHVLNVPVKRLFL